MIVAPHEGRRARAVVTEGTGQLRTVMLDVAPPGSGEVMVELEASGICHTDLDSLHWGERLVLGHEGAGVVVQVGQDVDVEVGTRVVLNWAIPCGHCFQCSAGSQSLCEREDLRCPPLGTTSVAGHPMARSFSLGTLSEVTVVKEAAVVPIGVDIQASSACIVGCGVMTGYGSVVNVARVGAGASVAVLGVGGVGLNVVQAASLSGAGTVIAIDRSEPRLLLAAQLGATHNLLIDDAPLEGLAQRVRALTSGRGADFAFECTGRPELAASPLALVRNGGAAVQVSGNEVVAPFDLELFEWDKTYVNPLYGGCRPQTDFPRILSLYADGRLKLDELVSHQFSIDQVSEAFTAVRSASVIKAVVVF